MSYATTSMSLQVAGVASSAVGSYYSARLAKMQAQREAEIADSNARIAELGAQSALLQGQHEVARTTLRHGQLKGAQRAAMAANGIDLGEGSAAEIQAGSDLMKEIDVNTIEANAIRNAWGYRTQGVNAQNEAIIKRGTASAISPGMAATSSLLSNAGSVAGNWYTMKKVGAK
jgi:hypothetical protein